jgi:uncharacterized protein
VNRLAVDRIAPATDEPVFFHRVFAWMAVALGVTGLVAYLIGRSAAAFNALFESNHGRWVIIALFLIQFLLVGALAGFVEHMSLGEAIAVFLGYAALTGLTFSFVFQAFTTKSIFSTFLVTGGMFAALAAWGALTKRDITNWQSFLLMALIGQLIGLVVNYFWFNSTLYWVTTATGIVIFSAYTAYDVQKLRRYELPGDPNSEAVRKEALVGALALYLDFVNLFLYLLRILGRRR